MPRHCLRKQGSRLNASRKNSNNLEILGKFQISHEYGRKFCPAIGNNGVNFVCYQLHFVCYQLPLYLFFYFIVCGSSGREVLLSGVPPWIKRYKTLVWILKDECNIFLWKSRNQLPITQHHNPEELSLKCFPYFS